MIDKERDYRIRPPPFIFGCYAEQRATAGGGGAPWPQDGAGHARKMRMTKKMKEREGHDKDHSKAAGGMKAAPRT